MQVDPLTDDPSQVNMSPYQFGWSNPVTLNDPSGECPRCPRPDKAMYAIAEGFRQVFDAAASFLSFGGSRYRKTTDPLTTNANGNISISRKFESTSTRGFKVDFSNVFDVAADNTRHAPVKVFTFINEDKQAVVSEIQADIKISSVPIQVTLSNEVSTDGSVENGVKVSSGVSRGPAKANVYVSNSTSKNPSLGL